MQFKVLLILFFVFFIGACTKSSSPKEEGNSSAMTQEQAQMELARRLRQAQYEEQEQYFKNPLQPRLTDLQIYKGNKNAPITIVEYTDFECPHCAKGSLNMKSVLDKYPTQVRLTLKHLPLAGHEHALLTAQYFEAIRTKGEKAAWVFHDDVFAKQEQLKNQGKAFLTSVVSSLGLNPKEIETLADSESIKGKVATDKAEAQSFGFQGTPAYVVNGVPIKGAADPSQFAQVIDRQLAAQKKK